MTRSGVGAMELVAMHLKEQGSFVSRSLSFSDCTFELVIAEMEESGVAEQYQKVGGWGGQGLWTCGEVA
jgi:hypothetical protein